MTYYVKKMSNFDKKEEEEKKVKEILKANNNMLFRDYNCGVVFVFFRLEISSTRES